MRRNESQGIMRTLTHRELPGQLILQSNFWHLLQVENPNDTILVNFSAITISHGFCSILLWDKEIYQSVNHLWNFGGSSTRVFTSWSHGVEGPQTLQLWKMFNNARNGLCCWIHHLDFTSSSCSCLNQLFVWVDIEVLDFSRWDTNSISLIYHLLWEKSFLKGTLSANAS